MELLRQKRKPSQGTSPPPWHGGPARAEEQIRQIDHVVGRTSDAVRGARRDLRRMIGNDDVGAITAWEMVTKLWKLRGNHE